MSVLAGIEPKAAGQPVLGLGSVLPGATGHSQNLFGEAKDTAPSGVQQIQGSFRSSWQLQLALLSADKGSPGDGATAADGTTNKAEISSLSAWSTSAETSESSGLGATAPSVARTVPALKPTAERPAVRKTVPALSATKPGPRAALDQVPVKGWTVLDGRHTEIGEKTKSPADGRPLRTESTVPASSTGNAGRKDAAEGKASQTVATTPEASPQMQSASAAAPVSASVSAPVLAPVAAPGSAPESAPTRSSIDTCRSTVALNPTAAIYPVAVAPDVDGMQTVVLKAPGNSARQQSTSAAKAEGSRIVAGSTTDTEKRGNAEALDSVEADISEQPSAPPSSLVTAATVPGKSTALPNPSTRLGIAAASPTSSPDQGQSEIVAPLATVAIERSSAQTSVRVTDRSAQRETPRPSASQDASLELRDADSSGSSGVPIGDASGTSGLSSRWAASSAQLPPTGADGSSKAAPASSAQIQAEPEAPQQTPSQGPSRIAAPLRLEAAENTAAPASSESADPGAGKEISNLFPAQDASLVLGNAGSAESHPAPVGDSNNKASSDSLGAESETLSPAPAPAGIPAGISSETQTYTGAVRQTAFPMQGSIGSSPGAPVEIFTWAPEPNSSASLPSGVENANTNSSRVPRNGAVGPASPIAGSVPPIQATPAETPAAADAGVSPGSPAPVQRGTAPFAKPVGVQDDDSGDAGTTGAASVDSLAANSRVSNLAPVHGYAMEPQATPVKGQVRVQPQPGNRATALKAAPAFGSRAVSAADADKPIASEARTLPAPEERPATGVAAKASAQVVPQNAHEASLAGHGSHPSGAQTGGVARDAALFSGDLDTSHGSAGGMGRGSSGASGSLGPAASEAFAALDAAARPAAPSWVHAGVHRAEAGFQDPTLGWVGVRADQSAGQVHATLLPGSTDAAQTLGGHMAGLNAYLGEVHAPVESLTLAVPESREAALGATQDQAPGAGFAMGQGMNEGMSQGMSQNSGQGSPPEAPPLPQPASTVPAAPDPTHGLPPPGAKSGHPHLSHGLSSEGSGNCGTAEFQDSGHKGSARRRRNGGFSNRNLQSCNDSVTGVVGLRRNPHGKYCNGGDWNQRHKHFISPQERQRKRWIVISINRHSGWYQFLLLQTILKAAGLFVKLFLITGTGKTNGSKALLRKLLEFNSLVLRFWQCFERITRRHEETHSNNIPTSGSNNRSGHRKFLRL